MQHKRKESVKPKLTLHRGLSPAHRSQFERITLLLQGGGALGAYQAGVYQALSEAGLEPDWVAGISIGAINAAIIAGNSPEQRVPKLREFWENATQDVLAYTPAFFKSLMTRDDTQRQMMNAISAIRTTMCGIPGFFNPRLLTPWLATQASAAATSYCDTAPLKATLKHLIDFDRINNGEIRFNIGTVHVKSGNFTDFDNKKDTITPEHIMASGALPPGFPPVEIGGEYYWDGGLVSNTPLKCVMDNASQDTLVFQVDLWSADGEFPKNMADVLTREKDIRYSSRTRANTDRFREQHKLCHAIASLLEKLPAELKHLPEVRLLNANTSAKVFNIVHLIYHNKDYEGYSKDFEFSRRSMEDHWQSGYNDMINTLKHPEVLERPNNLEGIAVFDFSRDRGNKSADLSATRPRKHKAA